MTNSRRDAAGTAIKQVHTQRLQPFRQLDGLVNVPTAVDPVRGGDPHCQRQRFGPCRSDAFRGFHRKSNPVFERTALAIDALVGNWREKTMPQNRRARNLEKKSMPPRSSSLAKGFLRQVPSRPHPLQRPCWRATDSGKRRSANRKLREAKHMNCCVLRFCSPAYAGFRLARQ